METMIYEEQLATPEWAEKRRSIMARDNHKCQSCGRSEPLKISFKEEDGKAYKDFFVYEFDGSIRINHFLSEAPIDFKEFQKEYEITRLKIGQLPHKNNIGILTDSGIFIHTLWNNKADYSKISIKDTCSVRRFITEDGQIGYLLTGPEYDLADFFEVELPKVVIETNETKLHVHHRRYYFGHKAWEYDDDDLVTLCSKCHEITHQNMDVHCYTWKDGVRIAMNYTPCLRCNGIGYLHEYDHVQNGICFRCKGQRFEELIDNGSNDFDSL